jgi:hypothetical protein
MWLAYAMNFLSHIFCFLNETEHERALRRNTSARCFHVSSLYGKGSLAGWQFSRWGMILVFCAFGVCCMNSG